MAREIPGYYFDEDKGKYFRIQQSHKVVAGTGYTKQSVREVQQAKKEQQRTQLQLQKQKTGKIVRSRVLQHSASPISARLGLSPRQNCDEILRQYGAGLTSCDLNVVNSDRSCDRFKGYMFSITRSGMLRASFDFNANQQNVPLSAVEPIVGVHDRIDLPINVFSNHENRSPRPAEILVSLYSTCGEEQAVVSTDGSSYFTMRLVDTDGQLDRNGWVEMNTATWSAESIWDITAAPFHGSAIAFATDTGLILGDCQYIRSMTLSPCKDLLKREQMTVTFKDINLVMSGERSGRVNFTDVRVGRSVARLLHPSAVLGTLGLPHTADNHVLVHGFSSTSTYDLRWVKPPSLLTGSRKSNHHHHHGNSKSSSNSSIPCMRFAVPPNKHTDHYTRGRKIACSADLNFIAAASSHTTSASTSATASATTSHSGRTGYITLYSARSGRVVDSPLTRYQYHDSVCHVEVKRLRDGPESIFCLAGGMIQEWGFGRLSPAEVDLYDIDVAEIRGRRRNGLLSFEQEWDRSV